MNRIIALLVAVALFTACGNQKTEEIVQEQTQIFGEAFTPENVVSVDELFAGLGDNAEVHGMIEGEATDVCQKKGCWVKLNRADGSSVRVSFKDYGFFLPMDIAGRTLILNGKGYTDTVSVDDLRHYAEDAGKTTEEIAAITQPEVQYLFEATGVILK